MPTLSLCMIVRDEGKFLEQCLNSVKDLVDEIIIVDTGSTDRTKKIAKTFTDKIFDFKWCDDFSAARNISLQHASGDWILVLDADEVISVKDHQKIRDLIDDKKNQGYVLMQRNYFKSHDDLQYGKSFPGFRVKAAGQSEEGFILSDNDSYAESTNAVGWMPTPALRLFKNSSGVSFSGVVHEAAMVPGKIIDSPIPIHHFGKMNITSWQGKWALYEKLAEKKVKKEKDYHAYFELGRQYLENKKIDLAKKMFEQSIALNNGFWVSWFNLGGINLIEGNIDPAIVCLENARKLSPNMVSIYDNLGVAYAKRKEFQKAIDIFVLGLNLNAKQASIYKNMALCYKEMGDKQNAHLAFKKAIEFKIQ